MSRSDALPAGPSYSSTVSALAESRPLPLDEAGVVCMPIKYASTPRLVAFERRIRASIGTALHIVIARRAGFAKEV
jgi:hypothetical protein